MRVQINQQDVDRSQALEDHLHSELEPVERRFGSHLTTLEVYLRDVNGPKGGLDKECKLEARPRGLDPVVVDNVDADPYVSIKGAVGKLIKAMEQRLGRAGVRR